MKKLFVMLAIAGLFFTSTSCKKKFDCTCTDFFGQNAYDKEGKGKNAVDACNDAETKILSIPTEECKPK